MIILFYRNGRGHVFGKATNSNSNNGSNNTILSSCSIIVKKLTKTLDRITLDLYFRPGYWWDLEMVAAAFQPERSL